MDDSCAVCAETLEWVAYGPCGHRDVCSTCVARLRFICDDRRCCICKSDCHVVFVTKALGDYTRTVNDFSRFPVQAKEGQVGSYCYHEDTQAFFDDAQHYKMIRAMCRLSCSVCDTEDDPSKRKHKQRFKNIGHLKRHLSNEHGFRMCDLCLEGRKVFICEQKLYTRAQLNRHMRTGDSEVDGTESERGGFAGHPMCEFCRSSFYGENELYSHMSTEHYTCHICQRQHPGQYEYYRDYDDLETHFRQDHFLCEDEACLAKKFIVFQTESDLKRHNALEHGGRMSRSKRNAVLQIPTSFRYRSSSESGQHRGRRRSFRRDFSQDHELNMAIEASLDRAFANDPVAAPTASSGPEPSVAADSSNADPLVQPFESLSTTDSEPSSRYRQAVAQSSTNASLTGSFFPPLSTAPSSSQQKSQQESQNTMAARLRRQNNATVLNVGQPRSSGSRGSVSAASAAWPTPVPSPATSAAWPAPAASSSFRPVSTPASGPIPVSSSGSGHMKPAAVSNSGSSSYAGSLHGRPVNEPGLVMGSSRGSRNVGSGNRLNHSNSAPNLTENISFNPVSDFPPVSAAQPNRLQPTAQPKKTEDIQIANKSLVERMRAALDYDDSKYSAFKEISQEYRQGVIDSWEYLEYVKQFDLTHLVLDLARLCPDVQKQKELIGAYNATQKNGTQETSWGNSDSSSRKDKGKKVVGVENSSRSKEAFANNVINTVKTFQSQLKPFEGEVEVLEKDGYRPSKGKDSVAVGEVSSRNSVSQTATLDTGSKPKKKTSKFHRILLGDDSAAAVLDVRNSSSDGSLSETGRSKPLEGSSASARTVWRNGDAQRLFTK